MFCSVFVFLMFWCSFCCMLSLSVYLFHCATISWWIKLLIKPGTEQNMPLLCCQRRYVRFRVLFRTIDLLYLYVNTCLRAWPRGPIASEGIAKVEDSWYRERLGCGKSVWTSERHTSHVSCGNGLIYSQHFSLPDGAAQLYSFFHVHRYFVFGDMAKFRRDRLKI